MFNPKNVRRIHVYLLASFSSLVMILSLLYVSNSNLYIDIIDQSTFNNKFVASVGDTSTLVAYWKFDDGDGTQDINQVADSSSNGNTLVTVNMSAANWIGGKIGNAVSLNGINNHLVLSDKTRLEYTGQDMTISLWFRPNANDEDGGYIFSKRWNNHINYTLSYVSLHKQLTLCVSLWGKTNSCIASKRSATPGSKPLVVGEWNHIVVRLKANKEMSVSLDNEIVASGTWLDTEDTSYNGQKNENLAFTVGSVYPYGKNQSGGTAQLKGDIDDFRIYNSYLTDAEIADLYKEGIPLNVKDLGNVIAKEKERIDKRLEIENPNNIEVKITTSGLPQGATFDEISKTFSWTPDYGQAGEYTVTFNILANNQTIEKKLYIKVNSVSIQFSCSDENNSKCIDFGGDETLSGITYNGNVVGEKKTDNNGVTYREILPKKVLEISIPAFNVDSNGLPLSSMLLEIKFKDTFDRSKFLRTARTNQGVNVYSRIDYINTDPLFNIKHTPAMDYQWIQTGSILYEKADQNWKNDQFLFQKTNRTILRSIGGKFILKIEMPQTLLDDEVNVTLPLDYISLRAVSESEANNWLAKQRENWGFVESVIDFDKPSSPVNYDPDLNVFPRDTMNTIYSTTKPKAEELNKGLVGISARGETESLLLGLYSVSGINGLTFEVSNLNSSSGGTISSSNILIEKVTSSYRVVTQRADVLAILGPSKRFAFVPNYLETFNSLDIKPNTSESVMFHISVPSGAQGGTYTGKVNIKRNGVLFKEIPVSFEVVPINLEQANYIEALYGHPYQQVLSTNQEEVFDFFKRMNVGMKIGIAASNVISKTSSGDMVFDSSLFEAVLDKYIQRGLLRKKVVLSLSTWPQLVLRMYGSVSIYTDYEMYNKLDSQAFRKAFKTHIEKLQSIAQARGIEFIYEIVDEAGNHPFERTVADILTRQVQEAGGKVYGTCNEYCAEEISSDPFKTPTGKIPPISDLYDYTVWGFSRVSRGFNKENLGFYTTNYTHFPNPIYGRFILGLYPARIDAKLIGIFAVDDHSADYYNDFDFIPRQSEPGIDYIFMYPTWSGRVNMAMSGFGVREGVKDARYIATLNKMIAERPGNTANQAKAYLNSVLNKIKKDYYLDYFENRNWDNYGYYKKILTDISETSNPNDFEAFSVIRRKIIDYILLLSDLPVTNPNAGGTVTTHGNNNGNSNNNNNNNSNSNNANNNGNSNNSNNNRNTASPSPSPNVANTSPSPNNTIANTSPSPSVNPSRPSSGSVSTNYTPTYQPPSGSYYSNTVSNTPNPDIYSPLQIPVTSIDTTVPEIPSWVDIVLSILEEIANTIKLGATKTIDAVKDLTGVN